MKKKIRWAHWDFETRTGFTEHQVDIVKAFFYLTRQDQRSDCWVGCFNWRQLHLETGIGSIRCRNVFFQLFDKGCLQKEMNELYKLSSLGKKLAERIYNA
jgi:hypothetical protein